MTRHVGGGRQDPGGLMAIDKASGGPVRLSLTPASGLAGTGLGLRGYHREGCLTHPGLLVSLLPVDVAD